MVAALHPRPKGRTRPRARPKGYTGLWSYLHRELGLSRSAAFHRAEAAALLRRIPDAEAPLRDGWICLSSMAELAKAVTPENATEMLPQFFRLSAREARDVVTELAPKAVVPERVAVTPVARAEAVLTSEPTQRHIASRPRLATLNRIPASITSPPQRPTVEPLTCDLRRLHVTVSRRFLDKLEAAKDALSHAKPGADAEAILEAGLDLILAQQAKRRAQVMAPRKGARRPAAGGSKYVPAEVRRAVWSRDEGRCQWPVHGGGICGSTRRLELDHVKPRARGGPSTVENLRILCAAHNGLAARLVYGEPWMAAAMQAGDSPRVLPSSRGRPPSEPDEARRASHPR